MRIGGEGRPHGQTWQCALSTAGRSDLPIAKSGHMAGPRLLSASTTCSTIVEPLRSLRASLRTSAAPFWWARVVLVVVAMLGGFVIISLVSAATVLLSFAGAGMAQ